MLDWRMIESKRRVFDVSNIDQLALLCEEGTFDLGAYYFRFKDSKKTITFAFEADKCAFFKAIPEVLEDALDQKMGRLRKMLFSGADIVSVKQNPSAVCCDLYEIIIQGKRVNYGHSLSYGYYYEDIDGNYGEGIAHVIHKQSYDDNGWLLETTFREPRIIDFREGQIVLDIQRVIVDIGY